MIVLIEENRHRSVSVHGAGEFHHSRDTGGFFYVVPVDQKKIRSPDDIFFRDDSAAVAGASKQSAAIDFHFLDSFDQFMDTFRL